MSLPPVCAWGNSIWDLPPLILHPFNEHVSPASLLENSKAALMLSGVVPDDGTDPEVLTKRLLGGRYAEIRMLYFLGKDICRWMAQCVELVERTPELQQAEIQAQSFADLLTGNPPEEVKAKLARWGVADYGSVFSRAIGLNALFADPPEFELLTEEFLRSYHRYADSLYQCYMHSLVHRTITSANFRFELYASGEYTRMLETEWGGSER
jgi:hypothetical protein